MSSSPHYRPDIDGLRAVALLLVILFHAGLGFQGGYIGVDVFFVISGFLITGQVIRELDAGEFSLANFWARRIRRLLPAATVMMVAVLFAGYFLLLPGDYVHLGWSAVAQQLLSANLYFRFWSEFGYFNPWTEENPLLHTWSLAVEEQFYLLYPLLLITLHGWGRRTMQLVLAGLALASLAGCEACLRWDAESAYYLLPTRAWELLLGGLVALCPGPVWVPRRQRRNGFSPPEKLGFTQNGKHEKEPDSPNSPTEHTSVGKESGSCRRHSDHPQHASHPNRCRAESGTRRCDARFSAMHWPGFSRVVASAALYCMATPPINQCS